jgi:hypothetical protein
VQPLFVVTKATPFGRRKMSAATAWAAAEKSSGPSLASAVVASLPRSFIPAAIIAGHISSKDSARRVIDEPSAAAWFHSVVPEAKAARVALKSSANGFVPASCVGCRREGFGVGRAGPLVRGGGEEGCEEPVADSTGAGAAADVLGRCRRRRADKGIRAKVGIPGDCLSAANSPLALICMISKVAPEVRGHAIADLEADRTRKAWPRGGPVETCGLPDEGDEFGRCAELRGVEH